MLRGNEEMRNIRDINLSIFVGGCDSHRHLADKFFQRSRSETQSLRLVRVLLQTVLRVSQSDVGTSEVVEHPSRHSPFTQGIPQFATAACGGLSINCTDMLAGSSSKLVTHGYAKNSAELYDYCDR